MTNTQIKELCTLLDREIKRLGSARKVATQLGVSDATISNIRTGKYDTITEQMWGNIAGSLGYTSSSWQIVDTLNYRMMWQVMNDAKAESMFFAISARAGSGKTATLKSYANQNAGKAVYYIQAREWSRRDFLLHMCKMLGIETQSKRYVKMDDLGQMIVDYFSSRRASKPLLIIDEADKLRPAALRFLIPLYNATEGVLGCIISGTDNLEKEIKRGARFNMKGYDEIDSRFGRQFVHLIGATKNDVKSICTANGVKDQTTITNIFKEASPRSIVLDSGQTMVVDDLRRLKRIIIRERLRLQDNA